MITYRQRAIEIVAGELYGNLLRDDALEVVKWKLRFPDSNPETVLATREVARRLEAEELLGEWGEYDITPDADYEYADLKKRATAFLNREPK